ncbi:MAG: T9SS type A sorting domain-containing protein [Candidatus Cloacimonadaceae bacterium]
MQKDRFIKALIMTALLITAVLPLLCIDFVPGSGADISAGFNQDRERAFFYHQNTDDQHWYGTGKWAVRFDFAAVYPTYTVSDFVINKVRVYFPMIPTSAVPVSIEIFSDSGNAPGALLSSVTADITSHWMEFTLPQTVTTELAWVVVNCATAANGPYMSASVGGGAYSYYWNTNTPTHYFQNMQTAGYSSELLISVVGRFELSDVDLELSAFDLKPDLIPGRTVTPEFTIFNNSSVAVLLPHITLSVTSPNPDFSVQDTIAIYQTLPPYSELTILYDNPEMLPYEIQLPDFSTQLKVRAVLKSEHDLADTLFNNTITKYYSCYNDSLPVRLVENFVQYNAAQNLLQTQDNIIPADVFVLNYFPLVADAFYSAGAVQRFNWYGFLGYPITVTGGDDRITGFLLNNYADRFQAAVDEVGEQKTFLQQDNATAKLVSPYNTLQLRLSLRNPQSYVYTGGADPSPVLQSRFFAALCRKVSFYDAERLVFNRWGAFADTIGTAIALEQSWIKQFSINISDIGVDSLLANYELFYWIQHNTSKQIIYANRIDMNSVVSNDDETVPQVPFSLVLAPNPLALGTDLQIKLPAQSKAKITNLSIYNLKGQLLQQNKPLLRNDEYFVDMQQLKSAGIYLIRFDLTDKNNITKTVTKKIFVY